MTGIGSDVAETWKEEAAVRSERDEVGEGEEKAEESEVGAIEKLVVCASDVERGVEDRRIEEPELIKVWPALVRTPEVWPGCVVHQSSARLYR
jgi:hypothetical protein